MSKDKAKVYRRKKLQFIYKRFKEFASDYLHNRAGMAGLLILVFFSSIAIFAPLITPYDPLRDYRLAAPYAAPIWAKYIDPGYSNAPTNFEIDYVKLVEEGTLEIECPPYIKYYVSDGYLILEFNDVKGEKHGIIKIVLTCEIEYNNDPPKLFSFYSWMKMIEEGDEKGVNYDIRFSITDPDNKDYKLWSVSYVSGYKSRLASGSELGFDSYDLMVKMRLGLSELTDLASTVFSKKGKYRLTYSIIFKDFSDSNTNKYILKIKYANFKIYGTVFGFFGTDHIGRDVFTQLVYGTRISLMVGLLSSVLSVLIGIVTGIISGYFGGVTDEVLMRFTDVLLVIPSLPLLIVLASIMGPNVMNIVILLGFLGWMGIARIIRSQTLSLKERPFVEAAKAVGAGDLHIMFKHILPQVMPIVYAELALGVPVAIVVEAGLSFLGLGDPSVPTWGQILYNAEQHGAFLSRAWWVVLPPGIAITILSLAFVLIGHALDEILNPRLKRRA